MKLIKKKAEFVGYVVLYCGSFPEWRCPDRLWNERDGRI